MQLKTNIILFYIFMTLLIPGILLPADNVDQTVLRARDKALDWLKKQKVPNQVITDPQPERRNLVLSYKIDPADPVYKYLSGRSIIYDNALAVIAFSMNGEYKYALQVLLAMERLQRKDGGFWFGYNTHNDWPSENSYEGATERTGATAWLGYAAVFYLNSRIAEDPSFMKTSRDAKKVLKLARGIADYLIKKQVLKKSDIRYGLITGGKNSYTLTLKDKTVDEVFSEAEIGWVSTEHNIDTYFFLRDFGLLTGEKKYKHGADLIKESMLRIWSSEQGQYYRGIKPDHVDDVLALDCASWGAVFSLSAGNKDYAGDSLATIEKLYASNADSLKGKMKVYGYKPYAVKEIYEEVKGDITKFYFPDLKGTTWESISGVWVEGSMGVALAYMKAGNRDKALEIVKNMLMLQDDDGGFIYFTREIPHEFSTYSSVASTAWFVIIASSLEDRQNADRFWGK